jgi:hypothetical protein
VADPVENDRELTGDDALRLARECCMEEATPGLFYAGVGDLIRFARLVRAGWVRPEWRAMVYAPRDGTELELLLRHPNWQYAKNDNAQWEQVVRAKWIDFNHGGWTWHGMYGTPQGWRPCGVDASCYQVVRPGENHDKS